MKTVLITGATSGIGLCIAKRLHNDGCKVYGTSRFPDKHLNEVPFELLALDITSEGSIQNCIAELLSKTSTLDVLINNAGIAVCGSAEETSTALANKQFQTNFWGAVNMTKAVLPIMRQQKSGNIITIGSLAGLIGVPFESYYSASKHALEGFFKSLRLEVRSFNIKISVVEPGFFRTGIDNAIDYAEPGISDYDDKRANTLAVFSDSVRNAPLPDPVAKTIVKILNSKNPGYSYPVGRSAKIFPLIQFISYSLFELGSAKKFKL
jgi:NAD(P)-dependent dehydrogenase (short-subunit alcohol dehydrogenase family)